MKQSISTFLLLTALSISCVTHKSDISRIYSDFRSDITKYGSTTHDEAVKKRQDERAAQVKKLYESGGLKTAQDYFEAAVVLMQTDDLDMLKLSETLALKSAEMGDTHGLRVAAEAIDKQLVKLGLSQRFGTQYIYEAVLRGWRLYPYDVRTTDAERQAMGVPPLAELIKGEEVLNQRGKPKL